MNDRHLRIAECITTSTLIDHSQGVPIIRTNPSFDSAVQALFVMAVEEPIGALDIIYYVVQHNSDETTLDLLTAGPLETVLRRHRAEVSPIVDKYSALSRVFKEMVRDATL
jgi:hypothetical protein